MLHDVTTESKQARNTQTSYMVNNIHINCLKQNTIDARFRVSDSLKRAPCVHYSKCASASVIMIDVAIDC